MKKLYFIGIIFLAGFGVVVGVIYLQTTGNLRSASLAEKNQTVQIEENQDTQRSLQLPRRQQISDRPQTVPQKLETASSSERSIGYITAVYEENNKEYLKIDYIEFFTGEAADQAAAEDGFDTASWGGVPDGIWQRNNNKKIRTFEVDPAVEISMASSKYLDVGTVIEGKGLVIPYDVFYKLFNDPNNPDYMQDQKVPYWITLKGGMVVKIEQQYLP